MTRIFKDQMNRDIIIDFPPKRIVSLVPSQTELLHDLGLEEEVVGITKFCVHPDNWFRNKQRVGGTKVVKPDVIRELTPDLIIGNKEENARPQIEELAKNYPVWMSEILNLEQALDMIGQIGQLVDSEEQAGRLIENIRKQFANLAQKLDGTKPTRAAYFIWRKPYMVAAGNTFINDMMNKAGFENVYSDLDRYPEVSLQKLSVLSPEILLLSSEPYPFKEKHLEEFRAACPNTKIKLVNGELFSWYGSRLLKAPPYFLELVDAFVR